MQTLALLETLKLFLLEKSDNFKIKTLSKRSLCSWIYVGFASLLSHCDSEHHGSATLASDQM